MLLLILFGLSLGLITWLKLVWSNRYARRIPTIRSAWPVVGHCLKFVRKSTREAFWAVVESFAQVDRLGKLMLGPVPIVFVNHPDLLKELFGRDDLHDKPFFYDFMGLGGGLITERAGLKWRHSRKMLNPTFNTRMLTGFVPIMDARARKLTSRLAPFADGRFQIDIMKYIGECTLEIVYNTTMGRNASELPGQKEYVHNLEVVMTCLGERMLNVNQHLGFIYRFSKEYKIDQHSRLLCNDFTDKIIRERKRELKSEENDTTIDKEETLRKSLNFLDQILTIKNENGKGFPDEEIPDHLYTIMSSAHDTSALTTAYTCLFLAMYPEVQNKVLEEMNEVFYNPSVEVNQDTLKQLEYTEMVIKEVLRLCPAVPMGARQTSTTIQLDDIEIPPGQILAYCLFTLHRRPDFWGPDPERFDPERFSPQAVADRHPHAYLPFAAGLRNCIGSRYAWNSMRIMLLRIVQNYELQTDLKQSDLRFKFEITLKLDGPHLVRLVRRDST
ncbi:cytochrome P450 4V2-like [Uranotaenia lowii]|uniref:cytochrome P450 4V2-like n=1 Tax=Uranotaenia lowii TaxID=190385 RepID=UPI0024799C25|nr:cytochrome P450 4V2-like [Uranotaenia lowii]